MKSKPPQVIELQPRTSYEPDTLSDKLRIGAQRTVVKHPALSAFAAVVFAGATVYAAVTGIGKATDYVLPQAERQEAERLKGHADFYGISVDQMKELNQAGAENLRNLGNPDYVPRDPLQEMHSKTLDDRLYK